MNSEKTHLFSFGLIGDVQYAIDKEKGSSYDGKQVRWYRDSINKLEKAVDCWNSNEDIDFCVNLGDLLDSRNAKFGNTQVAFKDVEKVLKRIKCTRRFDMLGNHEFYIWRTRARLPEFLNVREGDTKTGECKYWYTHTPAPGWRVIILDSFYLSMIDGSPTKNEAIEYIRRYNPNDLSFASDWFAGLEEKWYHMIPYNGGLGDPQLKWLENELRDMVKNGVKGLVFTHVPLTRRIKGDRNLIFDVDEIRDLFKKYPCVKACFTGHAHDGFYYFDSDTGVHHYSIFCPILALPGNECHSIVHVSDNCIRVEGFGPGVRNVVMKISDDEEGQEGESVFKCKK